MRRMKQLSSGFSLIEILVIITTIGILAGILLPVLMSARKSARKNQCFSNLQQLGHAFSMYLSDWNGYYPAPGGLFGNFNYWHQVGDGGLVSYIGDNGGLGTIWCCPELTSWQGRWPARTYSMNSYLRNPPDIEYPGCIGILEGCPESKIEEPRRTILLYEGIPVAPGWPDSQDYIYRCGNWTCVRGYYTRERPYPLTIQSYNPWHGKKNNYLYCDGHLRSFVPHKFPNDPPRDRNNEWFVEKSKQSGRPR
ncbi:MAG TPA: type II secretion system protein [Armatimonadota bacterium]|nr:type II secretion system protein [Armatimonadota bacterium]